MSKRFAVIVQDLSADEARLLINEVEGADFFDGVEETPAPKFVPAHAATFAQAPGAVPAATVPNVATPAGEVDVSGLPWDERIHASTKAINKDGTWKSKRGIQPVEVEKVTAELRKAAPAAPAMPAAAPVMQAAPAMPAPAAPAAPVAPAMPAAAPIRNFPGLMAHINNLFAGQKIEQVYPQTIIDRINAPTAFNSQIVTITDIAANPSMVDYAWACIDVDMQHGIIKA